MGRPPRPRPHRLERLPQQYFAALLRRSRPLRPTAGRPCSTSAAATPRSGRRRTSSRRCARPRRRPARPRLRAVPRAAAAERGDRRRATATVYGVELDPEREVAIVPGTKTASSSSALALAERGDTVLLPDPGYPDYPSGVALAGADLGLLPLDPAAGWAPDFDAAPAAAAAFLNYPSNPCAACAPPGAFEAAVAYAERTGAAIVARRRLRRPRLRRPRGRRASSRRPARRTSASRCGRCRRRSAWPAGGSASSSATPRSSSGSTCSATTRASGIFARAPGGGDRGAHRAAGLGRGAARDLRAPPRPARRRAARAAGLRGQLLRLAPAARGAHRRAAARRAPRRGRARRGLRPERRRLGAPLARGHRRGARRRDRAARARAGGGVRMKIGIVVPFSWSYWGGVVEHAENQAAALRARGHEVKIVMGNDPPGRLTRLLHPRTGRHGQPAAGRDPGRPLGGRAGERVAAEHRPLAAQRPAASATCCATSASTCSTCTSR